MKRRADETWREVVVGKAARQDGTSMGVLCATGGLCRSHEGASGFALEFEERYVSFGGEESLEAFVPVGKHRLCMLKVVRGLSAVKGALNETTMLEQVLGKLRVGEGDNVDEASTPVKKRPRSSGGCSGSFRSSGRKRSGSHGGSPRNRQGRIESEEGGGAWPTGENP